MLTNRVGAVGAGGLCGGKLPRACLEMHGERPRARHRTPAQRAPHRAAATAAASGARRDAASFLCCTVIFFKDIDV